LDALATSDHGSEVVSGVGSIVTRLGEISTVLNSNIPENDAILGPITDFFVTSIRQSALETELNRSGSVIVNQIRNNQRYLTHLIQAIQADTNAEIDAQILNKLAEPYIGKKQLPSSWRSDRERLLLLKTAGISKASAITDTGEDLIAVFQLLAEGKSPQVQWVTLLENLDELVSIAEMLTSN